MAMPALARTDWTVDMLDALPDDGQRHEIIDGELFVTQAPSNVHQLLVGELLVRFRTYLRGSSIARAIMSPSDVRRPDRQRNRVQPDVYVFRLRNNEHPAYPFEFSDLLLVIEVVSPSSSQYDYHTKRRLYLGNGIPEYWVLNPDARNVSRWMGADDPGQVLSERIDWHPSGMQASLVIDINELFDDALG